ncbi:TolC family protein [Myxococcus eversor]|uniref:TolC family protein n=1 Tax=Myxococcus eversor TaxID=2709661 RepID=UPI0013D0458F|nr:TolC family protein [Myxococcus eversor]
MKHFIAFGVLWMVLNTGGARAQDPRLPESVTLEEALSLLAEHSPWTAAERARVDVAAAERVTAGMLPNPSLSYGGQRLASGANTGAVSQHQLTLEQPLLLFGQRGVRREVADLGVKAEQARVASSLAERTLAVRAAFAALLARQESLRILEENQTDLGGVEQVVRGRASAGETSRYDVERIGVESRSLEVEVRNARADVEDAAGQLASLLGFPQWSPRARGTLGNTHAMPDLERLWEQAREHRPSLVAVRERQAMARGSLSLARRERLPVPSLAAGTLLTRRENSVSVYLGLSLPVPLFDRNQGAIARASAEVDAESRALDAEVAEARAELARAHAVLSGRSQALATLEHEVVERLPILRKMAEDAYREGRGSILELLDALRSLKDLRLLHLRQQEAVQQAEAAVLFASGLETLSPSR